METRSNRNFTYKGFFYTQIYTRTKIRSNQYSYSSCLACMWMWSFMINVLQLMIGFYFQFLISNLLVKKIIIYLILYYYRKSIIFNKAT